MSVLGHMQPKMQAQLNTKAQLIPGLAFNARRQAPSAHVLRCTKPGLPQKHNRVVLARAAEVPPGQDPEKFVAANKAYNELTERIETVAAEVGEQLQGTSLYLVGMMGSGKSTVGKMLSQALGYCFFDTDALIEQLAGKTIPQIFADDGEDDFRDIETGVLAELMPFKSCVVATGGGAVIRPDNWSSMQQGGIVVWLNGPPALLAHRVVSDGTEGRPLLANQDENASSNGDAGDEYQATKNKLESLLDTRRGFYQLSDIVVSLEGEGPAADLGVSAAEVVYRVLAAVNDRVTRDTKEREEKMNFEVVNETLPETMRVVKSINPIGAGGEGAQDPDAYLP